MIGESISVDVESAERYPTLLIEILQMGKYQPNLFFDVGKTEL